MSLDINLTNVQSKPIVVSANQTAENDRVYHVVANATFTDPTGVNGKGYEVFVRNGTATINSVAYTEGTTILRLFHSGAWVSYLGGGSQNLQQVTDIGNTTTNQILVVDNLSSHNYLSVIDPYAVEVANNITNEQSGLSPDKIQLIKSGTASGKLKISNITSPNNVTLEFPNKPTGSYTIATTADIPSVSGLVPYTGATQNVDLGEHELKAGQVEFDQTPTGTAGVAVMRWNDADGTIDLGLKGGNVTLQLGQEQLVRVVNKTATNINLLEANYQAVRVTGAQGQRLKVDLAQATNDVLSAETIGLVTETINNNQEGFITTSGLVRGINTTGSLQGETWADGDVVYLSATTAGRITNVKPSAPNHLVIIGYVVSAHATQGSVFVKVDNGYKLDELHNVAISTPLNNQSLVYETASTLWKNKALTTAEVADSSNKRYVTDANLTVIGNTSGTNTGDETQSSILSKLGLVLFKKIGSTSVTGTTVESILHSFKVNANSLSSSDLIKIFASTLKVNTNSSYTLRIRHNTINSLSGSTQIAILSVTTLANVNVNFSRENLIIEGGNLTGFSFTTSSLSEVNTQFAGALSSTPFDVTVDNFFFLTVQLNSASDSISLRHFLIQNF
jgi:ribosomal 30S subunit maturation factor RimM